jgi:quercetin 2,3-dioxygenase
MQVLNLTRLPRASKISYFSDRLLGAPMIEHRPFNELGGEDHGWLKAKQHFSFADYVDPARIGWGSVWNDDEIAPDTGFPPHQHANMEIITYVREGV